MMHIHNLEHNANCQLILHVSGQSGSLYVVWCIYKLLLLLLLLLDVDLILQQFA